MLGPLPVGLLSVITDPPTFSGYNAAYFNGITNFEWDPIIPQGVTGYALTFSVIEGSLPVGLTLNPNTGVISGTPTADGSYPIRVRCSNPAGYVDSPQYTPQLTFGTNLRYSGFDYLEVDLTWLNGFNTASQQKRLRMYLASGGGGGGAASSFVYYSSGGGGGSGRYGGLTYGLGNFEPGSQFYVYLGRGGAGGAIPGFGGNPGQAGQPGEASYIITPDSYEITVAGGGGGAGGSDIYLQGNPTPGGTAGGGNWGMSGFPGANKYYGGQDLDSVNGGCGAYGIGEDVIYSGGGYGIGSNVSFAPMYGHVGVVQMFRATQGGFGGGGGHVSYADRPGIGGAGGGGGGTGINGLRGSLSNGWTIEFSLNQTEYMKGGDGFPGFFMLDWSHGPNETWF
jgi:hypothetical protein